MKKTLHILFATAVLSTVILTFAACRQGEGAKNKNVLYSFTDALGRNVEICSFEKTAVLSGSLAEIWQLAGGKLYGVTNEVYERDVVKLDGTEKNYGGVQSVSVEELALDGADLVILSSSIAYHVKLCDALEDLGITAAYFDVECFEDYLDALKICTDITGRHDLYTKNGENIRLDVEKSRVDASGKGSPRILLLRAISTGVKAKDSSSMTGRMLKELGCKNIADSESSFLEDLSLEAIVREDPDHIFITTIGDSQAGLAQYRIQLESNPAWQELSAVKNGNVHILPKELYHYKPNVRWAKAYEGLGRMLYEE